MNSQKPRRVASQRRRTGTGPNPPPRDPAGHSKWPVRAAVIAAVASLLASLGGLYSSTDQSRQAQEAQASERFSRSVEQLGSNSIAVRVGAVYAFARLMRDSSDDQRSIGEILSSFVRVQAADQPSVTQEGQAYRPTPPDLLAALKILDGQPQPVTQTMLLSGANLSRFDFADVGMHKADLTFANLSGARLASADLSGSALLFADLSGSDLLFASLTKANLSNANLSNANLTFADLKDANLSRTDLTDANLTRTDMTNADLTDANLTRVTCSTSTKWPTGVIPPPQCAASKPAPTTSK